MCIRDSEYSAAIEYYEKVGDYKDSLPKKSAAENRIRQQELNAVSYTHLKKCCGKQNQTTGVKRLLQKGDGIV